MTLGPGFKAEVHLGETSVLTIVLHLLPRGNKPSSVPIERFQWSPLSYFILPVYYLDITYYIYYIIYIYYIN